MPNSTIAPQCSMVLIVLVMIKQWIQMDSVTLWRHSSRSVQHVLLTDKHYNITRPRFPAMGIHTYLWCLKNLKIGYQSVSITTNIYVPESVISILLLFMIFSTSGGISKENSTPQLVSLMRCVCLSSAIVLAMYTSILWVMRQTNTQPQILMTMNLSGGCPYTEHLSLMVVWCLFSKRYQTNCDASKCNLVNMLSNYHIKYNQTCDVAALYGVFTETNIKVS